ncbi:MAG: FAD binding domain-containing protein [Granulosicoccus sp.]
MKKRKARTGCDENVNTLLLEDALATLASGEAVVLAGGTDVYPGLQDRPAPAPMLDISRIAELKGIEKTSDGWKIGAGTSWTELIRADLPAVFDGLKCAARQTGSVQIQNAATVAGNLCNASPAADGVPPLLALNASLSIASARGTRLVSLPGFITAVRQTTLKPDELVTAIVVPEHELNALSVFHKLGSRSYLVISVAMLAVTVVPDCDGRIRDVRIAVGACSPVAQRLPELEAALYDLHLVEDDLSAALQPEHLQCLKPIDDVRGSAAYRLEAVQAMISRSLREVAEKFAEVKRGI